MKRSLVIISIICLFVQSSLAQPGQLALGVLTALVLAAVISFRDFVAGLWRDYEVGQTRQCLPYLSRRGSSRDVRDADHSRSRAHPCDDHDDQILDRDCLGEFHACRF